LSETFFWRVKVTVSAMQTQALSQGIDPLCAGPVRTSANRGAKVRRLITALGFILSLPLAAGEACAQRPRSDNSNPAYMAVEKYFASLPDYQPGDLVTRSQVAKALAKVKDAGTKVPETDRILAATLADSSFLAKELSTPAGRKFMRKVGRHPGAFSRLDRLSTISRGQTFVRDLIRSADGDKFIEYLTTTRGGRNLGSSLTGAQHGTDLNQPTGRIYTAEDLMAVLDQLSLAGSDKAR
jgi:hypothetical protein